MPLNSSNFNFVGFFRPFCYNKISWTVQNNRRTSKIHRELRTKRRVHHSIEVRSDFASRPQRKWAEEVERTLEALPPLFPWNRRSQNVKASVVCVKGNRQPRLKYRKIFAVRLFIRSHEIFMVLSASEKWCDIMINMTFPKISRIYSWWNLEVSKKTHLF